MSLELIGKWGKGIAYDTHTLSSVPIGINQFGHTEYDTERSEMGELVFQLKYRGNKSVLPKIISLLEKLKGINKFDYIVPVPSTKKSRLYQPVEEIAKALGVKRGVEVLTGFLEMKTGGPELKNIEDSEERKMLLKNSLYISNKTKDLSGCDILLVDDLYRSGATLTVATDILFQEAKVKRVCVLTMTKTRSNR